MEERLRVLELALLVAMLIMAFVRFLKKGRKQCFLLDYACYKPPEETKLNTEVSMHLMGLSEKVDVEKLRLQWRIYLRSGLGEETYGPKCLFSHNDDATLQEGLTEAEDAFIAVLDELFAKTGVRPPDIDFLIVNVSTFSPAPSHAACIVHRYKMKNNIKTYNLSGMGCAANVIALDLAKDLLAVYPEAYALLVGTESISMNARYVGRDKSMMLTECLFRVGANAVLLSNHRADANRAKMRLRHVVRTTYADNDEAYSCVQAKEDCDGIYGIGLSPSIVDVASEAIRRNVTALAPKVLPVSELLRLGFKALIKIVNKNSMSPSVPDFKKAFEHFCIHPGGRAIINSIGKSLGLTEENLEASRMALHRFGNTSTSGIWYEMAYIEAKRRLRRRDRVWQIALGSGFKCNSAVWQVLRETDESATSVWGDVIHRYPCTTRPNYADADIERYLALSCRQGRCKCASHEA